MAYCTEAVDDGGNGILPWAANGSDSSPLLGEAGETQLLLRLQDDFPTAVPLSVWLNRDDNILDDDESQQALRLDILVR